MGDGHLSDHAVDAHRMDSLGVEPTARDIHKAPPGGRCRRARGSQRICDGEKKDASAWLIVLDGEFS